MYVIVRDTKFSSGNHVILSYVYNTKKEAKTICANWKKTGEMTGNLIDYSSKIYKLIEIKG